MTEKRVPLFARLPEIYRTKDAEQTPPDQLKDYLALVEAAFGAIHENIEALYSDLFIETCDDWVIPYIGDLVGTSHLKGETWSLRADVADTIALRRRKGTLGAIELLTYNLTRWGVHSVELFERLGWNQHLNHQRPDEGGPPPYRLVEFEPGQPIVTKIKRQTPIRGGTITLRDPSLLGFLDTPFDPFAHTVDVKPPVLASIRYNIPNLAIFLWRLSAYRVQMSKPFAEKVAGPGTSFFVRVNVNPIPVNALSRPYVLAGNEPEGEPVRLFNTSRFGLLTSGRKGIGALDTAQTAPFVSRLDEVPGPIPIERLLDGVPESAPEKYVFIESYDETAISLSSLDLSEVGLQLHLPDSDFPDEVWPTVGTPAFQWKVRGANLCGWETGVVPALVDHELVIDPVIGRLLIRVEDEPKADALVSDLLLTYTYGAVGPVGAHPTSRGPVPEEWQIPSTSPNFRVVNLRENLLLKDALQNIHLATEPIVIEIQDSMTHVLYLSDIDLAEESLVEDGGLNLLVNSPLLIRAASNQRPIIELREPLRFRPANVASPTADPDEQREFDAVMARLNVRLEGIYLARSEDFASNEPLIARAALNRLELINCTLDPGGFRKFDGTRAPILTSVELHEPFGFSGAEEIAFNQIPEVVVSRTITGPVLIDSPYSLSLSDSIVDAGQGVGDPIAQFAVSNATDPVNGYGPPTHVSGITVFGRMRVESIDGRGGIWVHALEVLNNQIGCLKFSYFSGELLLGVPLDRLPQNHGCVKGMDGTGQTIAQLHFVSEIFGNPAYGQLTLTTDERIREQGPQDDAMGAFGFLSEAHKWRNLQIRFREFMPVGIRPLLIPVT
jgi:hypothetical protein